MALRIVKATEPLTVSNIVLTVYAAPGLGKSSLAFTAEKPLMLDFDKGAYRASKRGDSVPVTSWSDVQGMKSEDLEPYQTIIIDTAGRALDALAQDIISNNPKAGRADGSLTLQGFGTLKSRFSQWQGFLRSLGKDLILICHMDEQKNGDDVMERIDAQGGSKNEIYKSSDAMCRIRLDAKDARYLDFDPRQCGFGKNPAQLPKIPFPSPLQAPETLATVIQQIKDSINRMTTEQADAVKEQEAWTSAIVDSSTPEEFNALLKLSRERDYGPGMKHELATAAEKAGFKYKGDKKSGKFVDRKAA